MLKLPMRFFRYFIVILLFLCTFFSVTPRSFAQVPQQNPYLVPNTEANVKPNLHTWIQSLMTEIMVGAICQLSGFDPTTQDHQCLGITVGTGKLGYTGVTNRGAIGLLNNSIAGMFTLPIHTSDYTKYVASNFGLVKSAYADNGLGYNSLQPFVALWVGFRNISYLIFVIIFVVIGFAIMLRIKIDPRTVMTIENQIPKIIVGLILITFSFAIGGLMIDAMYVLIYVIFNFFSNMVQSLPGVTLGSMTPGTFQGVTPLEASNFLYPQGGGFFGLVGHVALPLANTIRSLFGITTNILDFVNPFDAIGSGIQFVSTITNNAQGGSFFNFLFDTLGDVAAVSLGLQSMAANAAATQSIVPGTGLIGGLGGFAAAAGVTYVFTEAMLRVALPIVLAYLILMISLFFALFRVWFSLLLSYAYILLDILLSPFWILGGLIPGSSLGFNSWLRDLAANLLAFPITIGMFIFGTILIQIADKNAGTVFVPPLIGNPSGGGGLPIGALLGIAILFLTPSAVTLAKDALKVKENKYGAQIGAAAGAGAGVLFQGTRAGSAATFGTPAPNERGVGAVMSTLGLR